MEYKYWSGTLATEQVPNTDGSYTKEQKQKVILKAQNETQDSMTNCDQCNHDQEPMKVFFMESNTGQSNRIFIAKQ